jgi:hypothetical protein
MKPIIPQALYRGATCVEDIVEKRCESVTVWNLEEYEAAIAEGFVRFGVYGEPAAEVQHAAAEVQPAAEEVAKKRGRPRKWN